MKTFELEKMIRDLVEDNPFRKNIRYLISHPEFATEKYDHEGKERYINCCGTALFCTGYAEQERPVYVSPNVMNLIIDIGAVEIKRPGSLVIYRKDNDEIRHSALFLGKTNYKEFIFHKPGKDDEEFCFDVIGQNEDAEYYFLR
ncbi:hypothetical protein GF361_01985 [Candidatus Woesearchaeota archaeon]|nr:hypothetical protein [Candidatus Woesearchaeota archaeon]